jgi:hypothetical protein
MSNGFMLLNKPTAKEVMSKARKALILNLLISNSRIRIPIPTMIRGITVLVK